MLEKIQKCTSLFVFHSILCVYSGMPLGLFKKVGKYPGTGGLGQRPGGGSRGNEAFSQSELPRKPPIDTHGRYTYNTCTGGENEEKKEKKEKKSEKRHPCILCKIT